MILEVSDLSMSYGPVPVLRGISFGVADKSVTCIVGSNCAGKSSLLNTIAGILRPSAGKILFQGKDITQFPPHSRVADGITLVPEGRRLFPNLSVLENLESGAFTARKHENIRDNLEQIHAMFPILKQRTRQLARSLSGGEQQMLALGRGLMSRPKLLMLDEPSLGLMPTMVDKIFETVKTVNDSGVTVLLVEQNVNRSLSISDKAFVFENGRIVLDGIGRDLMNNVHVKKAYLGL
jgi:branched-chain amino acid transport system ATP-binding protein